MRNKRTHRKVQRRVALQVSHVDIGLTINYTAIHTQAHLVSQQTLRDGCFLVPNGRVQHSRASAGFDNRVDVHRVRAKHVLCFAQLLHDLRLRHALDQTCKQTQDEKHSETDKQQLPRKVFWRRFKTASPGLLLLSPRLVARVNNGPASVFDEKIQ